MVSMKLCIQVWYILDCAKPFTKHSRHDMYHRLMKQTQYRLHLLLNKHSLHMISTEEAHQHLLDAVLQKAFRISGHLGTAGSACPQVHP